MSSFIRLLYHTGAITLAVIWAFVWLRTPSLNQYSLQLFGGVILVYFVIKKLNQADFWQLLPSPASLEMALATLAFLLLIGATGNIHSPLFPLSFVHLFFLTLSAQKTTTVIVMFEIILFHYSLGTEVDTIELSYLASLPIVTAIFILAKDQFIKIFKQKASIAQVVNITKTVDAIRELQRVDQVLENLLTNLITPQNLAQAQQISADENQAQLNGSAEEATARFDLQAVDESAEYVAESQSEPLINLTDSDELASNPEATQTNKTSTSDKTEIISERLADEIIDEVSQLKT